MKNLSIIEIKNLMKYYFTTGFHFGDKITFGLKMNIMEINSKNIS